MSYNIIKGNALSGGGAPPDGYFLAWSAVDGYWVSRPGPSGAFSAGLDLTGSSSSQTVIGIQGRSILNATPNNNDVLTWVTANSRWEPLPQSGGGGGGFTAGGDLSGTGSSQTVIRINGATAPAAGALTTGNVLQVSGTSALAYAAINLAGGSSYVTGSLPAGNQASQTMGGDVTGSTAVATVLKINGVSIPASPATGTTLIATSPTTSIWSQIYDGYVAAGANISGSKIAAATTGSIGVIQLANDLGGTATSPTVTGLNGVPVSGLGLSDGYVLTYSLVDAAWKPSPAPSGSFSASGDLSGNSSSQTVIRLQGNAVLSQVLGATEDGYALTWVNANSRWEAKPGTGGGGGGFTAGGDLTGNSTSQTVTKINGATVPVSGALTTGNILQVSGTSALSYGALNLAGGANYVTGTLPTGNQAAQSMGGDVTGSTAIATVLRINGTLVPATPSANQVLVAISGSSANWAQITDGYISASANIAGSKVANATSGTTGVIQLAGDLGGTATVPLVAKLQGTPVSATVPTDGYVLTYNTVGNSWSPKAATGGGGGGSFTAGGDLSGTSTSQTVTGLQNTPVNNTAPGDGYLLTYRNADGYWSPRSLGLTSSQQYVLPHDTTYNPIALYQFDNNMNDSSGNGRNLSLFAGTERYAELTPKLRGFFFDSSTKLSVTDAAFRIVGDMTVEMIVSLSAISVTFGGLFAVMAPGEAQSANYLSGLFLTGSTTTYVYSSTFWEFAAGTNVQYDNTTGFIPTNEPLHLVVVRQSNVVTMYVNGRVLGIVSGTLTAPDTVSGTQIFYAGGNTSDPSFTGIMSSMKVIGRALTSSEVNSEFNLTLGNIYNRGIIPGITTNLSGNTVSTQPLGLAQDGYLLTWNGTSWLGKAKFQDGYQHLPILAGTISNIGAASGTFRRIGTLRVDASKFDVGVVFTFESLLEATTGFTAEIRLYCLTDGSTVSTLQTTANTATLVSSTVTLSGNKIYEAQIRVTGTPAINDGAICSSSQILAR